MKTYREFVALKDGVMLPARPTAVAPSIINPFPAMSPHKVRAVLNPFKAADRPAARPQGSQRRP